jgi:Copper amine oxidase N-terminal domain
MNNPRPLSLRTLLSTGIIALAASSALAFSRTATIDVDGQRVPSDVAPVTIDQQAYLPLRAVTTALGAQLNYNKEQRSVVVVRGVDKLKLHLGVQMATLNGRPIQLSHAPFAVRGRTMVAARTIERALGPKVRYNARKSTIDVYTTDTSVAADQDDSTSDAF